MYMLSTKEELYLYLEKISRGYALNELVKEERAIKVNSRPVYFFHKKKC